ncbi:MAG TPA: FHA domain-containing protein [Kofleriaceae bacterium]|nr:FHA domain-containing protein [Kofleriaceae bacterium]
MQADRPQSTTLRELLAELKDGFVLHAPVLIRVQDGSDEARDSTMERTMTVQTPLDWADQYTREYGNEPYLVLGQNVMTAPGPITIGRSRQCDVKIENESVSKLHARLVSDPNTGGYFIIDESSRNGTCINGQPLAPGVRMSIWPGAYVSFGDAVFVFIDPPTLRKLSRLAGG